MNQVEINEKIIKIEKELNEVKSLLNKNLSIGNIYNYKGYDWFIIKIQNDECTLFMKDVLPKEAIRKYFKCDSYDDAYFSIDDNNDWQLSDIRDGLINWSESELDVDNLVTMETNYIGEKVSYDLIRLINIKELLKLPKEIIVIDKNYWTMTPQPVNECYAFFVYSDGYLDYTNTYNNGARTYAVRPVITIKVKEKK